MPETPAFLRPLLPLVLAASLLPPLALLGGCAAPSGQEGPAGESASSTHTYTIRGVVRQLPHPGEPGRPAIHILHEAIPNFVSSEGYETGMQGMTMPFPLADGVSVEGLEVGSWVEFTFVVDWQGEHPMLLTEIHPVAEEVF